MRSRLRFIAGATSLAAVPGVNKCEVYTDCGPICELLAKSIRDILEQQRLQALHDARAART
jgi:hypothetical protein